jgi:membrane protease YdiL (CAAX protease family)
MTSSFPMPPQPPYPDYSSAPYRQNSIWPGVVAWLVILCCVGFVVYKNRQASEKLAEKEENPTAAVQMKLLARTAMGVKALSARTSTTKPAMGVDNNAQEMLKTADEIAKTPEEKLRAAIIAGELKGSAEALRRLRELDASDDSGALKEELAALDSIYTAGPDALDEAGKQRLIEREGYYARMALAYGISSDKEPRKSLEEGGIKTALMLGIGGIGLVLFLLLALGLLITAIVLLATGKIRRAYAPDPGANTAFLEAFAIYLVLFMAYGWLLHRLDLDPLKWEWPALLIIPVGMWWVKMRGAPPRAGPAGFGFVGGRGPHIEIPLGIAGYLAGIPIVAGGFFITAWLIKHTHASPSHPIVHMLQGDAWHTLQLYGLACVFAPLLEEAMFRGALFHHLRRRWNWLFSAAIVALIFAIIHPQGWTLVPTLGAIAIVLAALREWRGSLLASITAHATSNFIVLTIALLVLR